jgi:hypothetical protein
VAVAVVVELVLAVVLQLLVVLAVAAVAPTQVELQPQVEQVTLQAEVHLKEILVELVSLTDKALVAAEPVRLEQTLLEVFLELVVMEPLPLLLVQA